MPGTGGLAAQQAMTYGLPLIVAKGDGTQDDLVRPENGWQVPAGDQSGFSEALRLALSDVGRLRSDCKSDSLVLFSHAQSMSATGTRPFDADADGLICSEGYVCLVMKTLPRALADGDRDSGRHPRRRRVVRRSRQEPVGTASRRPGQGHGAGLSTRPGNEHAAIHRSARHEPRNLGDATELNTLSGSAWASASRLARRSRSPASRPTSAMRWKPPALSSVIKSVLCLQHRTFVAGDQHQRAQSQDRLGRSAHSTFHNN